MSESMLNTIAALVCLTFPQSSPIDPINFDRTVIESLRQIHDQGAKLYNDNNDYAGCQRLYEGALLTISPLLTHHPAIQTRIEETMKLIDKEATAKGKAFKLHELIEAVRADLKVGQREITPAPQPRKPLPSPAPGPLAGVPTPVLTPLESTGRVTLNGQSSPDVHLQFVSLDRAEPLVISLKTTADGWFRGPVIPTGRYAVTVDGPNIPTRYATTTDSKLVISIGPAPIAINLKK